MSLGDSVTNEEGGGKERDLSSSSTDVSSRSRTKNSEVNPVGKTNEEEKRERQRDQGKKGGGEEKGEGEEKRFSKGPSPLSSPSP